jgi:hypothetical protein
MQRIGTVPLILELPSLLKAFVPQKYFIVKYRRKYVEMVVVNSSVHWVIGNNSLFPFYLNTITINIPVKLVEIISLI